MDDQEEKTGRGVKKKKGWVQLRMPLSDGNTFGMGLLFGTCPGHLDTPGLVSTFFDSDFPSLYDGEVAAYVFLSLVSGVNQLQPRLGLFIAKC